MVDKYWHFVDPKLENCKHKNLSKVKVGGCEMDECSECKMRFNLRIRPHVIVYSGTSMEGKVIFTD